MQSSLLRLLLAFVLVFCLVDFVAAQWGYGGRYGGWGGRGYYGGGYGRGGYGGWGRGGYGGWGRGGYGGYRGWGK